MEAPRCLPYVLSRLAIVVDRLRDPADVEGALKALLAAQERAQTEHDWCYQTDPAVAAILRYCHDTRMILRYQPFPEVIDQVIESCDALVGALENV